VGRPGFILQHVGDAHMAQTLDANSKPIGVVVSLVGLYLHVEKGFSGGQVQQVHKTLAQQKRQWPAVPLPVQRGRLSAIDVMASPAGTERDAAIDRWCESVWAEYQASRDVIVRLLHECRIV
jgi:hypothetical protein